MQKKTKIVHAWTPIFTGLEGYLTSVEKRQIHEVFWNVFIFSKTLEISTLAKITVKFKKLEGGLRYFDTV